MHPREQQRKLEEGMRWLHQLNVAFHRFVTTPDEGNRDMLVELMRQYALDAQSGSIVCVRMI